MKDLKLLWNLDEIIKDEKHFLSLLKKTEKKIPLIEEIFKKLSPSMSQSQFRKMIKFEENIERDISRLKAYVLLLSSMDIKNQKVMKYKAILENVLIKIEDKSRPVSHWIKGLNVPGKKKLDKKNAKRLFSSVPKMEYALERERLSAKHTLSEKEESIIIRKDLNGIMVVTELYDKIINDFRFRMKGIEKKLTLEETATYFHDPDSKKRKEAYNIIMRQYGDNKEKLFSIYSAIIKDWKTESELRKYESSINMRNFTNEVEDKAIEALISSCTKNRKVFWDFFDAKAKLLGSRKLSRYDLNAPVETRTRKTVFGKAKDIVLSTFDEFHPEFRKKAEGLFSGHIDSHPRKNKAHGGFCMSVTPGIDPYILLNFTGKPFDITTLAHELGHAIHDIYSSVNPPSLSHAPLPLCETASTFCEMVTFEKLIHNVKKEEKITLLSHRLREFYATISRQNYFIRFELDAHKKIPEGLVENELSEMYLDNLKEEFGDSVTIPDEFRYEWSYIPHIFHTPFYCYSYSFGELLSLSLYSRYKKDGDKFIPKIEKILSAGGSRNPRELLKEVGMDINEKAFWDNGFKIVRNFQKELEELI